MGANNMRALNTMEKCIVNNVARIFYQMSGYKVEPGYDFSVATHPQEKLCWNQSLTAYAVFNRRPGAIKHQI